MRPSSDWPICPTAMDLAAGVPSQRAEQALPWFGQDGAGANAMGNLGPARCASTDEFIARLPSE